MKIIITRAFERTRQIADFIPIKTTCSATAEAEWDAENPELRPEKLSQHLQALCESEVEKTLINYRPVCIACGAKGDKVILNKEGVCGTCVQKMMFEAKDAAASNAKNRAASQKSTETIPMTSKPPEKAQGRNYKEI